jgi:hypothetical protein
MYLRPPPPAFRPDFRPQAARAFGLVLHVYFFDWETAEPAKVFVTELERGFCSAADALLSMDSLVVYAVHDWDKTVPARLF